MKNYFCKLVGPRPIFGQDFSPEEIRLMQEHSAYLRTFAEKRQAVAFGPVADPAGFYGIGLWELPDDADIQAICAADPIVRAGIGYHYEIHPMPLLVTRS